MSALDELYFQQLFEFTEVQVLDATLKRLERNLPN
jgi:hypothetical protein